MLISRKKAIVYGFFAFYFFSGQFELKAGDDAKALQWIDISDELKLYANHKKFIMLAAKALDAHWRQL